ncbi:MAG: GNAT family N-acetyltransferase [Bacteroides sp.]|nr:GNAT family N-acetyltransferase [Bacteroides sp.]
MIQIQKQTWYTRTLYLLTTECGNCQLDIYPDGHVDGGVKACIHNLWVEEECRKSGAATALMNTAEELARRAGVDAVYLEWDSRDTPRWVLEWYRRRGYDEVEFGCLGCLMKLTFKNNHNTD